MRSSIVLAAIASLLLALGASAHGSPDPVEARTTNAGFSRKLVTDSLPAVMPRARETSTIFATIRVTAEIGEDR